MRFFLLFFALSGIVLSWTKYEHNPVLEPFMPWANIALGDPEIIEHDGIIMAFTAAGVDEVSEPIIPLTRPAVAFSDDGFNWTLHDEPVIRNGIPGTWDSAAVETVCLLADGDSIIMLYAGERRHGGGELAIGLAVSHDNARSFTRYGDAPVFPKDTTLPYEWRAVDSPTLIRIGDSLVMFYTGQALTWELTVNRATSIDGINWHRYEGNPVLDVGPTGDFDDFGVYAPTVRQVDDYLLMLYQGLRPCPTGYHFDSTHLGAAFSYDNGLTWTRSEENPILFPGDDDEWDWRGPMTPSFTVVNDRLFGVYWDGIGSLGIFTKELDNIFEEAKKRSPFAIRAYPNPFNSGVKIETPSKAQVVIYDIRGNVVHKQKTSDYGFIWQPDCGIPSGVYTAIIENRDVRQSIRLFYVR